MFERYEDHPDFDEKVRKEKERLSQLNLSEDDLRELIALNRTIFKLQLMVAEILKKGERSHE